MRRALLPFLVLALAAPAVAAPKIVGESEVKAGGFARLSIEGGKTAIWSVTPTPTQEEEIAGVLVFTGAAGVEYTATAVVIDFEAKTAAKVRHVVRFKAGSAVGSIPPPDAIRAVPALATVERAKAEAARIVDQTKPASGVPAAQPFRDVPHATHSCPRCGHTSRDTHEVRGWLPDGRHRHQCPVCAATWVH